MRERNEGAAIITHGGWQVRKAGLAARLKLAGATRSGGLAGAAGKSGCGGAAPAALDDPKPPGRTAVRTPSPCGRPAGFPGGSVTSTVRKPVATGQHDAVDKSVESVGTVWGVVVDERFTTLWTADDRGVCDLADLHRHRPPAVEEIKMLGGSLIWAVPFGRGRQSR
jgi:hypothetical protein